MEISVILDAAKNRIGAGSDYALATALGVSRSAVSYWRSGRYTPDAVACEKLANLSGFPLHQVIGIVGEARAASRDEKRVWRKLAGAALITGIVLISTAPVWASGAVCTLCSWLWRVTMRVTFRRHKPDLHPFAGKITPAWT
jgi:transcriptional regulator with XRE-family HTH domain